MITLILFSVLASGQATSNLKPLPEWYRVYTFEDSIIELNTDYVMFSERKTGRVLFRWISFAPDSSKQQTPSAHEDRLEEIECDCQNTRFRLYDVTSYDAKGRTLLSGKDRMAKEWRAVRRGSMMEKLFTPACKLIERTRREPTIEK